MTTFVIAMINSESYTAKHRCRYRILMKKFITHIIIVLFAVNSALPAMSQNLVTDSLDLSRRESNIPDSCQISAEKFNPKQLILPGSLMLAGVLGTFDSDNNLNLSVRDAMTGLSDGHRCKVDDYLRFLPSASHLLLGNLGVKSKHDFKERFLISATSHAAMLVLGYGFKYAIHEQRPDLSDNHSFPSGHVALAFTGAELLRSEYGTYYGLAGYAVATGVAFLRLYNNQHWFHDVLMGAGIGILSARIGNWLLSFERKLFRINNKKQKSSIVALMPGYDMYDRAMVVSLTTLF